MAELDLLWTSNNLEGDLSANNIIEGEQTQTRDITYALVGETCAKIQLNISATDYKMTALLKDKDGNTIYTSNVIDLPLESMVINGSYNNTTKKVILTLQNGNTIEFSVGDLINGLVNFTDYATADKGGVIKKANGLGVKASGQVFAEIKTYAQYSDATYECIIGKGTLENVLAQKIGDIESILEAI